MSLAALESKYFDGTAAPIYSGNTEVTPLIHGEIYFTTIQNAIDSTVNGDSIFIVGWQFSPDLNLRTGELVASSSTASIGAILAGKRLLGVDVRIVLNGTLIIYQVRQLPFSRNLDTAEFLRNLKIAGQSSPPLADRVLFDWSGANWTGSHHQKATVIRRGSELIAFVGGMDMVKSHWDKSAWSTINKPHTYRSTALRDPWKGLYPQLNGTPWGWHDIGVRLRGEAAKGIWDNFRHRWEEASSLPDVHWKKHPGDESETPKLFNSGPIPATPIASATLGSVAVSSKHSVQVMRSRFKYKIPNRLGAIGVQWKGISGEPPTPGAFFEVFQVLKKAIGAATKYIYIEDQFLDDMPYLEEKHLTPSFSLFPHLQQAASRGVKLIFLGSGRGDPDDPVPPLKNQTMTVAIKNIISNLAPAQKDLVAVWRLDQATVHSKLVLIDDEFVAIGSANFQSRSMFGIDSELHTAIVAEDDLVKNLRMELWAEHWILDRMNTSIESGLQDLDKALALWRDTWYPADKDFWWLLTGYSPTSGFGALKPVSP